MGFPASNNNNNNLIIMELGRFFLSALISGTVRRVRRKRGPNVKVLSGGCSQLEYPAKTCEIKVLRQLAIRYYRMPFCFMEESEVDYGIRS